MSDDLVIGPNGQPATAFSAPLIRSGADLVEVTETFYLRIFRVALCAVIVGATCDALYAEIDASVSHRAVVVVMSCVMSASVAAALRRASQVYCRLRLTQAGQAAPGLFAAALLLLGPYGPMWFTAMGLVLVTAVVSSLRTTLLLAVLAMTTFTAGTVIPGADFFPEGDFSRFGAAIGLVVNGLVGYAMVHWVAGFVLRLHRFDREPEPLAPKRVSALVEPDVAPGASPARSRRRPSTSRLTARQLEVVVLLRDGLHHAEIAECLSISARQVERHSREARERVGARTTSELVAMLVENRLVPPVSSVVVP